MTHRPTHRRTVDQAQLEALIWRERAKLHPSSQRASHVYYLPRTREWMTARPGRRRGTFELLFFATCGACQAATQ
ncbi:MAG TPA: hypothetical protein ENK57_10240 [Polyangiaceae bacterium]|nr:hypothetical protein [Polyangiaceae bacterium]